MKLRKILAVLLSVLLLAVCVPLDALPVLSVSAATSGTTGDCTWTLDGTHLTISGNGAMGNYDYPYSTGKYVPATPWGTAITSVTIEDGVTAIGEYAFSCCKSLTTVTIPDSVTTIRESAFHSCTSLIAMTIPDSVTTIGNGAFYMCIALAAVTIPDSITTIGMSAFSYCTSLTSVTIPNGINGIFECAFYNCSSLESVTIPNSVTAIGYSAFGDCGSLIDVYYSGSKTDRTNIDIEMWGNDPLLNATWHYNYTLDATSTPGDANGDGAVNNRDVALLQQYINKWEVVLDMTAADANGDGAVNNRDVALLQQYINKWDVELG